MYRLTVIQRAQAALVRRNVKTVRPGFLTCLFRHHAETAGTFGCQNAPQRRINSTLAIDHVMTPVSISLSCREPLQKALLRSWQRVSTDKADKSKQQLLCNSVPTSLPKLQDLCPMPLAIALRSDMLAAVPYTTFSYKLARPRK